MVLDFELNFGRIPDYGGADFIRTLNALYKKKNEKLLLYSILFLYLDLIVHFLYASLPGEKKKSLDALGYRSIKELRKKLLNYF